MLGDIRTDPGYVEVVSGMASTVAVPLIHKKKPIGALNILSRVRDRYSERDANILRQFASHVAAALENARLFEQQRLDAEAFELLAEIGREVAAVLDLDQLLARIAQLAKRVIDYRTFGILLLNESTNELEMKVAVQYGEQIALPKVPLGEGLVGYAALHCEAVVVPDVSQDPRYIKVVDDVRSEAAIPMLLKERCIGVFDLESPELDAFAKRDIEILTLLASQAAVAIENARLYEEVSRNEARMEKELQFARRVQMALLPTQLPKRLKGVDVAAQFAPARELGGDFHDFLMPESNTLIVALGDVSGKGVPAALYSVFAGELVRGRTFRRRFMPERSTPAAVLSSINTILHERQLEEYYCTMCYAVFDMKKHVVTIANSGIALPGARQRRRGEPDRAAGPAARIVRRRPVRRDHAAAASGRRVRVLLGRRVRSDERAAGGIHPAAADGGGEGRPTPSPPASSSRRIVSAVAEHRAGYPPNDDMTVVAIKIADELSQK